MVSLITIILRYKKLIILVTAAAFVLSAVVSLLLPQRFVSVAVFLPVGVESDITGLRDFFSTLGELGEVTASFLRASKNLVIDQIVRSRRMSDLMNEQFGLAELYGKSNADDVREELRSRTGLVIRDEGVIVLSVEDGSAERAKQMLDAYLANLDSILVDLMAESAGNRVEFLEAEISRRRSGLAGADSALQAFQTEYGVYEIEEQARAALEVAAVLSTRYSMLDVEKSLLEMTLRPGAPELESVRMEWEFVGDRLLGLKEGETGEQRLFPALDELPDLSYRYARLMIEKRVQEFVLAFLQLQKMDAMMTANQRVSAIKILDPPFVPGRRVWPRRKQIVIVSTLSVFFWMCFILVAREQWKKGAMSFDQRAEGPGPPDRGAIGGEW